ncbi:dihydroorotase [Candidatus Pacebacteria bacterium]|nr:dihydroorotase [Candidatus Paceibacterota bacterium]
MQTQQIQNNNQNQKTDISNGVGSILIKNGHVIDPKNNIDEIMDVYVVDDRISKVAKSITDQAHETIDAQGLVVTPGLLDLQVHFREPGREDRETIETGSRAAIKGGVTSAVAMPNTTPVADNQAAVEFMLKRAKEIGLINLYPTGAITRGQDGAMLAEMWELKNSGAVAVTDDGVDVQNPGILRNAMEYAKTHDMLIMSHCETDSLTDGGVMHEGWVSTQLGLPDTPAISEDFAVEKNIMLAKLTGARLHLLHNSTKGAAEKIRRAKEEGHANITAEVSVQHFSLTDEECLGYNTDAKMYPPLRSRSHVDAIIAAIKDGSIDTLTTDHAPHIEPDKLLPFEDAAMGSVGLETSFAVMNTYLVERGHITLSQGIALMTHKPAEIIQVGRGSLEAGAFADIAIFDTQKEWTVDTSKFESKGKNCVFKNKKLKGKAVHVIVNGVIKMLDGEIL